MDRLGRPPAWSTDNDGGWSVERSETELATEIAPRDAGRGRGHGQMNDEVLAEWVEPRLPEIFSRWFPFHRGLQQATSAAVIDAADARPGDVVLDVGSGAGIPALDVARRVGPTGRVMATDPSDVFVAAVLANAAAEGLTNLEATRTSVTAMPFGPGSFDAATCHMGVMFFRDAVAGLEKIREVVRPGGRAGFVAWGPESENLFFGSFWAAAGPYLAAATDEDGAVDVDTAMPTDAPGPMRYAVAGSLSAALGAAGFADVREETRTVEMVWPGRAETLLEQWVELSGVEARVARERWVEFRRDVVAGLNRYADGETVRLSAAIVVASGAVGG